MNIYQVSVLIIVSLCTSELFLLTVANREDNNEHYLNEWIAEVPGGMRVAREVAEQHGFKLLREMRGLPDHYLLTKSHVPYRSRRSISDYTDRLLRDRRVIYAAQQQEVIREKRDFGNAFDDPEFNKEWYIRGKSSVKRFDNTVGLRVMEVWNKNITGNNIVVTIIDDGVEDDHPDLKDNYDPMASFDINDNDSKPYPRYDFTNENNHGTRCAGVVSMVPNNGFCGVGIAYNSKIGGIRLLDGAVYDRTEAESVSYNLDHIDIYSASWGPRDNGHTCELPRELTMKAFELGIKTGRNNKGALYVWASGNGGLVGDNCNCDGFVSHVYTIGVSSVTQKGNKPNYGEICSSTLTTVYSSGTSDEGKVVTSDLRHECTTTHTGTSAAAPMAAGIIALLLEANPNVTWRDVQHIIVETSKIKPLAKEKGWYRNGVGYCVNLAFGFGLMDALAMVELADPATWKGVGEQKICKVQPVTSESFPKQFSGNTRAEVKFNSECGDLKNGINFLEHVQLVLHSDHERRGDIYVELESPMGTVTPVMLPRALDSSREGFDNWPFMSTHNWGERPQGVWTMRVKDTSNRNNSNSINGAHLMLYGTTEQPQHQKSEHKQCLDNGRRPEDVKPVLNLLSFIDDYLAMFATKSNLTEIEQKIVDKIKHYKSNYTNKEQLYVKLLDTYSRMENAINGEAIQDSISLEENNRRLSFQKTKGVRKMLPVM